MLDLESTRHFHCSICGKEFVGKQRCEEHEGLHATPGKVYPKVLEQLMNGDKSILTKGNALAQRVEEHFKNERNDYSKKNYYAYSILAPYVKAILSFSEFIALMKYSGRGQGGRIDQHNLSYSIETNQGLLSMFTQCLSNKTQPIAFLPFTSLLSEEAGVIETSIICALDPKNLCNEMVGANMPKKFANWNSDKIATLGVWYLDQAFKIFGMIELEKLHKTPKNWNSCYLTPSKWLIPVREKKVKAVEPPINAYLTTDFELHCYDTVFPVHKSILMANSNVFCTMFNDPASAAILAEDGNLILKDTNPVAVNQMLTYMYSGALPENFLNEHAPALMQIAEKYTLESLKSLVEKRLIASLDDEDDTEKPKPKRFKK